MEAPALFCSERAEFRQEVTIPAVPLEGGGVHGVQRIDGGGDHLAAVRDIAAEAVAFGLE
jgi:hypothetical protein